MLTNSPLDDLIVNRGLENVKRPWKGNAPTCGHPDRKNRAYGMCDSCYDRHRNAQNKRIEPLLNFTIRANCPICGDGYGELRRRCQLNPTICDVCHAEYCECSAKEPVELMSLDEVARLTDAQKIPVLRARKMTLRLAGKITNSLPKEW